MKFIKIVLLITTIALLSCKSEKSLEQYFIQNEDNNDVVIVDVPVNMVKNTVNLSKDEQKAIKSVKKINILYLKKEENNKTEYEKQKNTLKEILKSKKYQTLSKIKTGKTKIDIKFIGTDDAINEVVLFATDNNKGFFLARILGNKMNPENMQLLLKNVKNIDLDLNKLNNLELNF